MNFDELVKYWSFLETISLLLGIVLIGGAITLPDLNKTFENLLANHAMYLSLFLVIAIIWLLVSIFTSNTNNAMDAFVNVFVALFAFSFFVLLSLLVTIMLTGRV